MDSDRMNYFKERLEALKQDSLNQIHNLQEATEVMLQDAEFGVSNHLADEASDVYEREKNQALITDRQAVLNDIEAALERIQDGSYGICQRTGKPISEERLEAIPYAAFSIEHDSLR